MNRLQNTERRLAGRSEDRPVARKIFRDEDKAWVDVVESWQWLPGSKELLWVSERDGWRHAWTIPREPGTPRLLTPGNFDILSVEGVDEKAGYLYFIASPGRRGPALPLPRAPGRHGRRRARHAGQPAGHALLQDLTGRPVRHPHVVDRGPAARHRSRAPARRTRVVRMLESNAALAAAVAPMMTPPIEFFQVDVGEGVKLDGWMLKPKDFDPAKKYPLLMYVYGEPAGVEVVDSWRGDRGLFHRALADAGYIVGCVDNRGTPAPRGREWRKVVYGAVGVLASKEQAAAVRQLLATRPYLDPERVASWGWSGGGSMTLNLLFRSPDLYKVGMSVAPVPDQTLYDTIYQERYMGLPRDNAEGYKNGSPISFAEGLKGKLLLVHGSGDDNVHFQGSERLVNRLIALGKPFTFMDYPNRTHAIDEGEGTSLHLHTLLARYLMENLPAGPATK